MRPTEAKGEEDEASLALLQESGYDENVSDVTILHKLPPLSVESVARIIIDLFSVRQQHL